MSTVSKYGLRYWVVLVLQTRRFGHAYVHVGARHSPGFASRAFEHGNIVFSYTGFGRSLTTRKGHKYKVYARCAETNKPVPSKVLRSLCPR